MLKFSFSPESSFQLKYPAGLVCNLCFRFPLTSQDGLGRLGKYGKMKISLSPKVGFRAVAYRRGAPKGVRWSKMNEGY